jgi:hypothetical protein
MIGYPEQNLKILFAARIGINQEMFPVFWVLLLVATIAWLFLSRRLYDVLKRSYPEIYTSLGSPTLFMRKSIVANYKVFMFLMRNDYESTKDKQIIRLCKGLRYILFLFLFLLAGCLILLSDLLF